MLSLLRREKYAGKISTDLKKILKYIIYRAGAARILDVILFRQALAKYHKQNRIFLTQHPHTKLPPDYFLYETYQLNYRKFIEDGLVAAREILEWTAPYDSNSSQHVLDWGCGVGRIIRHLPQLLPGATVYGCDINEEMIAWDKANYTGAVFTVINNFLPTLYAPGFFNLVYGLSVFTHITACDQAGWVSELCRILQPGGLLLITTHGLHSANDLTWPEKKQFDLAGVFTQPYHKAGHRMMFTCNHPEVFRILFEPYFILLEFHAGPGKIGDQDIWIWQKK